MGQTPDSMDSKQSVSQLLAEANECLDRGDFNQAIELFKQAIASEPAEATIYASLENALVKTLNDQDSVVRVCVELLELYPDSPDLHVILNRIVRTRLSESNFERLRAALVNAIGQLSHQDTFLFKYVHLNVALLCLNQGKVDEGRGYCQDAIQASLKRTHPDFVRDNWNQGIVKGPDFLLLGFMKCGTTALHKFVTEHPRVLPGITKEPFFFQVRLEKFEQANSSGQWENFDRDIEFYKSHFPPRPESGCFQAGEASATNVYLGVEHVLARYFPDVKLIVILRDPVERAVSHYHHRVRSGFEPRSFSEAIESQLHELDNLSEAGILQKIRNIRANDYVAQGLYYYFLNQWMQVFPREQFLVLENDELNGRPTETMDKVFEFLKLPPCQLEANSRYNVGSYQEQQDPQVLGRLSEFYQEHHSKLERLGIPSSLGCEKRRLAS